jgi:uncharacterized protein (DUF2141 family)
MNSLLARLVGGLSATMLGLAAAPAIARDCAGTVSDMKLVVVVEDVRSERGLMVSTLYPGDATKFLKLGGALQVWRAAVSKPVTSVCVWLPGPGVYSMAVYQDVNSNGKFDHKVLRGIEPFGFSDNPPIAFSQPKYEATAFRASGPETTIHVKLNYK